MAAPSIDELSAALAQQTKLLESDPSDRRRTLISELEDEINRRKTQASEAAAEEDSAAPEKTSISESAARLFPEASAPGANRAAGFWSELGVNPGLGMDIPATPLPGGSGDLNKAVQAGDAQQDRTAQAAQDHPWVHMGAQLLAALGLGKMLPAATSIPGKLGQGLVVGEAAGVNARTTAGADLDQVGKGMLVDAPLALAGAALPLPFLRPAMPAANASLAPVAGPALAVGAGAYGLAGIGNAAEKGLVQGQDVGPMDFLPTDPMSLLAPVVGAAQGAAPGFRQNLRNPASGQSSIDVRNVEAAGGQIKAGGADIPSLEGTPATGAQLGLLDDPQGTYKLPQGHGAQRTVLADQLGQRLMSEAQVVGEKLHENFRRLEDQIISRPGIADRPVDASPIIAEIDAQIKARSRDTGQFIDPADPVTKRLIGIKSAITNEVPGSPPPPYAADATMSGNFVMADAQPGPSSRTPAQLTMRELVALRRQLAELGKEGTIAGRDETPFRMVSQAARELFAAPLDEVVKQRHQELNMQEQLFDQLVGLQDAEINERASQPKRVASAAEKLGSNKRAAAATGNRTFQESVQLLEQLGKQAGVPVESPGLFQQAVAANSAERLKLPPFRTTTDPKGHVRFGISPDLSMAEVAKVRLDPAALMSIDPRLLPVILGTQKADITIDAREQQ